MCACCGWLVGWMKSLQLIFFFLPFLSYLFLQRLVGLLPCDVIHSYCTQYQKRTHTKEAQSNIYIYNRANKNDVLCAFVRNKREQWNLLALSLIYLLYFIKIYCVWFNIIAPINNILIISFVFNRTCRHHLTKCFYHSYNIW